MIVFRTRKRDKTGTPILKNKEIMEHAERVLGDYKPQLLKEPGKVNGFHFIESYLGATVDYQDIYYGSNEQPIAGATVFNDDVVKVFNREGQCTDYIKVKANTIIIDNETMKDGKGGFANFTALHEGGHLFFHPEVYRKNPDQLGLFEPLKNGSSVQCCRKIGFEGRNYNQYRFFSPEEIREHQANMFAAFMAMPRQTFIPYAEKLIKEAGFEEGIFVYEDSDWETTYPLGEICRDLSSVYGVSFTAAKIHLKELGLIMPKHKYELKMAQATI